jgi:hypothetical protein
MAIEGVLTLAAGSPFVDVSIQSTAENALAGWPPFLLDLSLVGGRHLTNLTIHLRGFADDKGMLLG